MNRVTTAGYWVHRREVGDPGARWREGVLLHRREEGLPLDRPVSMSLLNAFSVHKGAVDAPVKLGQRNPDFTNTGLMDRSEGDCTTSC